MWVLSTPGMKILYFVRTHFLPPPTTSQNLLAHFLILQERSLISHHAYYWKPTLSTAVHCMAVWIIYIVLYWSQTAFDGSITLTQLDTYSTGEFIESLSLSLLCLYLCFCCVPIGSFCTTSTQAKCKQVLLKRKAISKSSYSASIIEHERSTVLLESYCFYGHSKSMYSILATYRLIPESICWTELKCATQNQMHAFCWQLPKLLYPRINHIFILYYYNALRNIILIGVLCFLIFYNY